MAVLQSNHLIEFSSVSGVVYVSVDQQLYRQSFKKRIKVWVVMDDELSSDQPSCFGLKQKENEQLENCFDDSSPVHIGSSSTYVPIEESQKYFTEVTAVKNEVKINTLGMENSCDEETVQMPKQKVLNQKHKGLKARKRKKEKISNFNAVMKSSGRKKFIRESPFMNTRDKSPEINPCLQPAVFDGEKSKEKRLDIQKDVFCEYCSKSFRSREEFYNHRKVSFVEHSCEICHKVFPFKAHLTVHMSVHENRRTAVNSEEFDCLVRDGSQLKSSHHFSSQDVLVKSSETSLTCEVCGVRMSSRSILKTHMMKHTGEKAYKCCVCSEQFNSIAHFTHHMTTHRKCGKVQCKLCNIGFENRSELSKHQLTHEYNCSLCDTVFPNKTSRAFHYRLSHKDDILRCPTCDKLYSSDSELKLHLKYHQRGKTQCTICGCFVSRLSDHLLSHSSETGECSIYVCDKCPKQFKQKLCFQRHLRTHSEEKLYTCVHCPKRFARSGGLSRHMLTHTLEKPFVCPVCGKACTQMSNLKSHMQTHKDSGRLLYCSLCGMAFADRTTHQEHLNNAHVFDGISSGKCCSTSDAISTLS